MEKLTAETYPDFLPDWNISVLQDPRTLLHEAFEAQVDRTPDALAVAWEGERLTYRELDEQANRLAAHLRSLGVGPEARVGVCVERSAGLMVALLATLKAGGAYVPLDPNYPVQRNAHMLDDSRAGVVLAQRGALASLPPLDGRRTVLLDEQAAEIARRPAARLERLNDAGNLAYLIYTSGSTGRPKGVAIEHHNVVSLMRWAADMFSPRDLAGVLASTSICFDISIFEMFAPLCLGGAVIVAGNALDLPYLPPDPPVTLISTVPSAMAELVRTRRVPASVRIANLGGEALPGSLVEEIHRTTAIERVYNVYGPSEDTTYSTCALIPRDSRIAPPVGDPLPGTRIWLLDADGTPVPFGEEGEVYLSGEGLSRGYFGRPELTAERFLPDPFSGEPGGRMYRVGDLGRFLPDGQLHYVGRVDFQVKIRGFRVELGEVEDALMRHPAVREAAVMARGDVAEGKHLVAWLAADGPAPEVAELRSFLGLTLPHYMIPSRFVCLEALPRTLNGKVDRKALPDPEAAAPPAPEAAPRPAWDRSRPVGETLARIWGEVLHLAEVRPDDHFFHLGGHSLLGARVLARVRETFGVDLPVQALFQAPTVEGLAGAVSAALREGGHAAPPPVRRLAHRERLPLSFAQERFWFLDRLQPGSAVYNVPLAVRLAGELDGTALEAALGEIVRRHEALRTRFVETAGALFQEVAPAAGLPLPRIDLAALPEGAREAELSRLVRAATAGPFDLSRPPLVRARLVRLGSTDHALLTTFHHAVFDGWSEGVLNRELSALYAAAREGSPSPLPEPPVQYGDYAAWQRSWLTPEMRAGLLDWWRGELAGASTELELPADRPRPEAQAFRGAVERMDLPAGLTAALADLARDEKATRFMVLLAAFQTLVWRLTGQADFLVGSPSANRPRPELEGIVGLFLETLALRGRLGGDPPFRVLLARARETALRAYAHQDLPFEHLVAGLGVERSPARSPLIQAMLSLQAAPEEGLDLPGLAVRLLDPQTATSRLDLSLVVEEAGGGLRAALEYDSALFDAVTARRLLGRFFTVLAGAVADPARPLPDLPLFSAAERHQLLVEWNDTEPAAPSGPGLLRRIEERARRTPDALAVAQGHRRATFGELEAQAGRLARRLRRLGAGPEALVAVCLPRSIEAVAAFLAVWKTGAAYVPLDPSYPVERLAFVLADSGAPVLIAQGELADALARPGVQVVDPDAGEEAAAAAAGELPGDALAYVIYTSGSTGRPKGVEVAHRSLLNLVEWHVAAYGLDPGDRATMLARVGFDASVWEIWPTLAAGASLHLPDEEALTDPEGLRDWLVAQGITVSFLPTPLAELLVGLSWPGETALRALLTGGDALRRRPAAGLPFRLVNHYGPTEATVVTTAGEVAPAGTGGDRLPPIGRPLPGVRVHVLDAGLRPLPAGVPGELVIGGAGLARGYLGALAETAERYVPDPFSGAPGARLYRTGDLVRSRPDGEVEFLGRIDRQVKLRGFRLELGEIEAALARHPEVREAAVIVAGARLVAFAAPRRQPAPPADEVLDFVRRELPDYMVPAALVTLSELPLSPNGKIDRNALAGMVPAESSGVEAPSTPEGERIARIWREVLELDSVGPRDDFFRLGGHSLLAAGVIARIREAFGVDLPVQALFRTPTVEGLAGAVAEALRGGERPARPPVLSVPRAAVEPAVPADLSAADVAEGDLPTLVARTWADVLGLPAVGPGDNFFDLGGHSLLGARVLSRIRDLLGVDLPLRALFRTPTVEGLAETLAEALRGGARPTPRPLAAGAPRGERLPLSFAQERFWLLDRLERGVAVYNIPLAYSLEGVLDAAALEGALREVVRRHGALRTRFVEVSGSPFQEVLPPSGPELPRVDLAALPEPARREELARLGREEAAGPFDLGRGPLLRVRLVRLGAAEHVLLATFHHAVFDGWSQGLFERELSALYAAALEGRPSPLPEPALQYTDYALWQRSWLDRGVQEELLDWWGRELAGAPAVLTLPTDRPRPEMQASRGARERLELSPALAEGVAALGRAERATRFMVLLAAFQTLLGALAGQEDLLVGSPAANRPRPELEGLIGLFVETVVLRGRLAGDLRFRELLGRVREAALGAFAHQDLPFERLVAGLRVQRSSARNPLIQVLFALEEAGAGLSLPGLAVRPLAAETATSKFDLSLFVKEAAGGLWAELEYDSDLFDPTTARRFLSLFSGVLSGAVADPSRRLSEILPVSAGERRQIAAADVERVGARPASAPERAAGPSLPSREMELELVAQIWSELLGVPAVGPDDNFFHLGGHSLVGARMLARVHELLGVDLAIRELFRAPTVRGLVERIAFLRAERPVLTAPVQRAQRGGLLPVSFVQESLWFLHLLEPLSPVYNIPLAWRLRGRLDAAALAAALGGIVRRHEVLRASFVDVEGQPFLEIAPALPPSLPRIELSGLPAAAREAELARLARAEAGAPFDLGSGPLLRVRLAALDAEDHVLLVVLHHSVFDGSSQQVLGRELAALYQAATEGTAPRLPELPVQYADFAAWQRSWLRGGALEGLLAFWRDALAGAPMVLELPFDRPRPPVQTFRGAWEVLEVPAGLGGSLLALGRREGATPFMTLLAAFQTLLYRVTGQSDLLVGSPVANRPQPDLELLIGYFVDTVVLRGRFRGEETFRQRIARAREAALDAFSHQELPFELLATGLRAERDPSRNPVFQVMFALDGPAPPLALPGLAAQPLFIAEPTAKFDLSLGVLETEGALRLTLEYNLDLFDPGTARRLLRRLEVLLEAVAADPGRRLDAVPLLSAAELRELIAAAERTTAQPAPRRLHDLFIAQAARTPEAPAVLTPAGERLTYAELARRSRRFARFLIRRGVGPEVPVGVCLERSPAMVAALLGVLEAGGVYLPLDPEYPAERLTWMLEDSGARLVLTREGLLEQVPAGDWEAVTAESIAAAGDGDAPDAGRAHPESLAYLIYTSGSTGKPKGVGVPHAGAAAHIEAAAGLLGVGEGDRMLWFASPSFDISVEEVLTPLSRGAAVVLRDADLWAPDDLLDRLARLGVTVVDLPTAYWHQWVAGADRWRRPAGLPLRLVVLGGEAMSGEAARRWWRSPLAGIPLLNGYGPTETIVTSTAFAVEASVAGGTVPIGRPLAGRSAWVLDGFGHPVPAGTPGELCVGGPLLARGYLGRPDLTAQRFVPDPFASRPGSRLYRTGDLARLRPDGVLEFLGRVDRQLKVRGFRVELGEVESALARHPAVRETVVDARPDLDGQRLVAWIVPAGPAPAAADLAGFLRGALPEPMVPSAFVMVAELPLTPNGKVDLRALPAPEVSAETPGAVAPRTPTEERLAGLWRDLLGPRRIGVHDSFFALGGHSLLATRLLSRVRDAFGVEIPVRALFSAPTLEALAALVDGVPQERGAAPPRRQLLPVSFAQRGLWLVDRLQKAGASYNLPTGFRLTGPLDRAALAASLDEVVRRHEALRTRFVEHDGEPFQEIVPAAALALPLIDLRGLPEAHRGRELARLCHEETRRPFDLSRAPLLRARLFRLAAAEHALLVVQHHIVSDAWSIEILARELGLLYEAAVADRPSPLPALPLQYADFAAWQRQWLGGGTLEEELAFWKRRLAGVPVLELPADHPRPAAWSFRGAALASPLTPELEAGLRRLCAGASVTPFMALLAVYQVLLARVAGQTDFAVGSPAAGRHRPETQPLLGAFLNLLPLRADLSGEPSFQALLERVRETVLDAYAHQDLPFEKLVEALASERDPGRHPLVQTMFQYLDQPEPPRFPGLAAEWLEIESGTAKLDLLFEISETGQGLVAHCEYARDLFDAATVQRLLERFAILLGSALAAPETTALDLEMLTATERRQLLVEWNDTLPARPAGDLLHRAFEARAARTPAAVALIAGGGRLTYAELNGRANRLARHLRNLGVGPEALVGVCLERSADLPVALLAVLKAGGAYVPLDPAYPAERIAWMLEDSRARVVISRRHLLAGLPAAARAVCLDGDREEIAAQPPTDLAPLASPGNLAYLIYTSGSTGRAKGVAIAHRSAAALMRWVGEAFSPEELAGVLASTSVCFDVSVFELFAPLAWGGAVILAENALALPEAAREAEVTLVSCVPSAMAELVRRGGVPPSVRTVNLGGEALPGPLAVAVYRQTSVRRVLNVYGPSEDTTYSTWACIDHEPAGAPPIGRPVTGTRAYVLDARGSLAPAGSVGELFLSGDGLARGYFGRPALTAERFVPNPFGTPGSRLYRTGDLVRWRPDGELHFLARADHQVKIRGFRVEPGEIEEALARHPAVREAAVVVGEDGIGGKRLVAFVAAEGAAVAELREHLGRTLPDFMVPAAFVALPELPRTPNGKVDRRALEQTVRSGEWQGSAAADAPRTPVEEAVAAIWAAVLRVDRVGRGESFFSLGGHSLLVGAVLARIRDAFGVDLPADALFAAPTVAALAARVESARGVEAGGESEWARAPLPERLPLSFSQRSLWLVERLQPAGGAYNLPMALRLGGPLDAAALAAALGGVVERHEALRTRFAETDGEPWQEILPATTPDLAPVDLSALPADRREEAALALARAEIDRPFELAAGPLLRACLFRLGAGDHLFLLVVHHAVSDGWSDQIILRDLAALYQAAVEGRPALLPPPPLQFADYAVWQRRHLRGEALESLLARWRERLAGVPALELPTDHRRPAVWSFRGATRSASLDRLSAGLERLARDGEATPFMALLAAAQVLLGRYAGQSDFAIGTPTANRTRSELEEVVGFFVNMLPLRADLAGAPSFRELLGRVRATALEAFAHQGLPFELLVEELAPERDLGRNPIFQVVLQLLYSEEVAFPGLAARQVELAGGTAKFDLNFFVERRDGGLSLTCEYAVDLFEAATIQRLLDQLELLLAGAIAEPDRAIGDLPLLSPAERHHLLAEANDVPRGYPREATIHQLVEEAAARAPEAVAVLFEDRRLTYRELDDRAGRLAARLVGLGVQPEDRVALLTERSLEMVVALLAVLKAGAAYAPIDPSLPAERMAYLLADLRPPVILVQERLRSRIPRESELLSRVVSLDDPLEEEPLARRPFVTADSLAYVLYTSGSTGRPKGVACVHRGVVRLVKGEVGYADLGPERTLLQLTALTFDPSVMEIWGPLTNGGRLVVFPPGVPTFEKLEEVIAGHGVDTVWLTTGLFHQVVDERPGALAPVRQLLAGGDVLSPSHVRRAIRVPPGRVLVNGYGPTESTLFTTCQAMWSPAEVREPVSIGRPVNGTQVYVLDRELHPVPFGVPGELYIGGDGLARCYDGRPDLTAERFVPGPFAGRPGERLYRTGDLVRMRPSGELDFLGRLDFQVKVRGFRIELGEIDAALGGHPAVQQCAVVVRQDSRGDKHLVAYVAAPGPERATVEELRSFLAAKLPSYMVPATFVLLPALPLNAHGKVDRRALPEPDLLEERDFTAPRNATEERLAALWTGILGIERIGVHENFFAAGGHSLRAVQLVSRLRHAFGVDLGVHALFAAPTIAELAEVIQQARGEEGRRTLPPIRPISHGGLLPVSFPQQRLWFVERLAPDRATYNIPMSYRLRGRLYAAALAAGLGEVVRRHETLRTRFVEVDGQPWQEILPPPAPFVLPVIDLSGLPEARRERELARVGREEAGAPFDLAAGLMRSRLIKLGEREHAFLVTLHHIAFDGWSEEVMRRELSALYAAALTGKPAHLPEMRIQYADFAAWQRSWPEEVLAEQLAYWSERLGGVATLEIPTDRPRPPVQTFRGGIEPFTIDSAVGDSLRALVEERGVTLFMLLLGGWQTLLHRISGQTDVAVGSPVANRTRSEIEGLIGFFVNMLAFRTDFGGDPSFAELLGRVRQTALEAYDHADVPFERLVDELRLERDLSRNPVVQVMFALQNAGVEELRLPGMTLERLDFTVPVAKFDLTLWLREESEGDFSGWIEYNADLFDRAAMARLAGHLGSVLAAVAARPGDPVSRIDLLTPHERRQILEEWNDTRTPFPESVLIHQFFEAQVDRAPGAPAAVWQDRSVTYGELEARANRLAHLLRRRGLERGAPVGVWMERSIDMLAGVLGVLKAGGYYLPLDPAWPAERVESILGTCAAPAVLTRSAHLGPVLEMQWRLPALAEVICLDVETPAPAPEPVDAGSISAVFDLVAEAAVDRVTAGGFVSSYTGERFSEAEVDEYRDRVLSLARPWLGPDKRVLEIGSGSGLILWEIAPRVARCVGLDASALTQARNRERAAGLGLANVELPVGFAHEIEGWPEGSFDLVILASTIQFFPGPLYLERIVSHALRLLAPGGALVIADVPDARRQEELRRTVEEQRALRGLSHGQEAPKILSVDEDLFRDLAALPGAGEVSVRHRETGFANELGFRYDVVLTRGETLAGGSRRKRLWTSWHVEEQPADRLPALASPEDLAYIIHTSGSTGQPKGIAVQHRPVANLFAWLNPAFGIGPDDRVLFVTSLCFDLSVYDIFGLLAAGGCVHVASEEDLRDAERLTRMLVEEPITLWDSAPAALVRLAPLFPAEPAVNSRLRRVMLSGDWIPVTLPDRVRAAFPHAGVTSLGGATEATVWSNWYPIGEVDPSWPSIPYGRPIDNARYHVLDAGLQPCPIGVPGDLYIGGDVLCVGYSHQPAVTAAAFIPDPFSGVPGARIYRTGDRARWFADGNLEFLGRVDQQVKIRGFRIELGEIEVALARHPEIREAVALAREDVPGDKRLVAYVVPAAGAAAPTAIELREFLRHSLPDYMIPAAFVELDHLPVTANGKLDRRALPAPRWDHAAEAGEADLPAGATEQALAGLWREILGVETVSRNDDFFDLGGHSLLATQLVARLREAFGAEVPLRVVFQSPSLAELAAEVDSLVAELGDAPAPAGPVIQPVPREGELPLSASQLRQWFLVQLEPESAAYNLPVTVKLDGELRVEVLAAALREIVRRHEALRTTFAAAAGRPYAVVSPVLELPLPLADLAALPEAAREAEARRLAGEDLDRPFDLIRGPLLRATLIRLAPAEHVLAVTFHHIVFDGSSLGVFLRELAALCEAFAAGRPSPLPELPVQYVDYAAWQRGWMAGPGLAGQLDYWKRQLAGASRVLDLPTDRPRPAVQSHRGRLMRLDTPPSLAAGLKAFTGREGVTLFMAVLAGYATVLGRYTGQEDLNVGSFVANRRHEVLERLIGFFVNTLVLRADLSGDPTFRELLARTRDMTLDAFERQELPFEQLLDELQIERDPSRTPLFQAMFGVQNFAIPSIQLPGLSLETIGLTDKERTTTDLSLYMWEEEGVMTSWMEFSTDLFDAATMERLFGHIGTLLAAAEADPGRRLSELPLMSGEESRQVLRWSAGGARREPARPVHERMREQARRAPEAPAVVAGGNGGGVLTYGELDRRAGRVARGLRRLGAGPGMVVGLCIDRSPEMIVALYGILGSGAAYLPLDPGLPADRLVLLAGDAGVPVVLTRRGLAGELPELPARLLRVDADFEGESGEGLPEVETPPASAAYVLYTSGSTGTPKGVVVEHRALGSFVQAAIETYGFGPADRVLQFANLAFDTSVEEIYPCLAVGGALVLRDEEMLASPARFLAACREAGITVLDLPTAWWHELSAWVEREAPALPAELRLIILGGERALPERVRGWLAATGDRPRLFNSYGPTEGTVVATACDLRETAPAVPIGRPLPSVEVHVLDPELRPVPAGVPGEICLGGADLARGYLGRPDLTAERFVPSPYGPAGARLYRTGDLGRWRPDGRLDFAGRVDDQVKIRGFRIEPGEVAAALARHPAIQEAVVVAHEVRPGERELTAYAVSSLEPWPEAAELRAFLKESLPAYMIPSGLMLLGALPRTATGKVDRRALPAPDRAARHDREYAAPETPSEELIAGIWQELLGVEPVGIYDNFFDLGGHSLLAPQVISRVGETFEIELPLRVLFEAPTVAQMANAVEQILLAQIEELSDEEVAGLVGGEA